MPRGFNDTRDLVATTSDGTPFIALYDRIRYALDDYNALQGSLRAALITPTTLDRIREGNIRSYNSMQFERSAEYGRPDRQRVTPVQPVVERFIPIEDFDLGLGFTRKYLALASSGDVTDQVNAAITADKKLLTQSILQQLFRIENLGALSQYKAFWNADASVPPDQTTTGQFDGNHTHYLTSVAWDAAAAAAMQDKLTEHGLVDPGVGEIWINEAQEAATRAMATFYPVPTPPALSLVQHSNPALLPDVVTAIVNPAQYIGVVDRMRIRVFNQVPSGYVFAYDAAPSGLGKPLIMREYPVPQLRGLQLFNENPDSSFPLINSFFLRAFGITALDRNNGVCLKVTAGAYTTPAILPI